MKSRKPLYVSIITILISLAVVIILILTIGFVQIKKTPKTVDISGNWEVMLYIEESSYEDFIGKNTTNQMNFKQDGDQINADGMVTQYNMIDIPKSERTALHLKGIIQNDSILVSYSQDEKQFNKIGEAIISVSINGNKIEGVFNGEAAKTKGRIIGRKTNN